MSPLDDPALHALTGPQAHLAQTRGAVRRFRPDVAPFFAFDPTDDRAWTDAAQLADRHQVVLTGAEPADAPPGWDLLGAHPCHQMVLAEVHPRARAGDAPVDVLGDADIPAMTALVRLARPGPFLPRTIELGRFIGVRAGGQLVAMAGERMRVRGHTEITSVCTHPDARGQGLGELVTHRVASAILARGERPFLHVAEGNEHALAVYDRLGFTIRRGIVFEAWRPPGGAAHDARAAATAV